MAGIFLKQSTASQARAIGPFLDDTDFKTTETGLTIANTDIKLVVNGAASANKNSGGGTHRVNGVYGVTFDATDTATVGEIEVSVVVSGALPVFHKFFVIEEAVYDMLFGASAIGYITNAAVSVAQFGGSNGTFSGGRPEVNVSHNAGTAITSASGRQEVNVSHWSGTANPSPATAGYPVTTIKVGTGTGEINLSSGGVPVRGNIKKAAAFASFPFLMTDSTNHNPATGKTVTVTICKGSATSFSALNSAPTVVEKASGMYHVDLDATDTNADVLTLKFTATACDDTFERIVTSV